MKIKAFKFKPLSLLLLLGLAFTSCSNDDDNALVNQNPSNFNLIEVPDGALEVALQPTFSWSAATTPDDSAVSYDLYLDKNNTPTTKIAANLNATISTIENNLDYDTIYYWRVVAENNEGETKSHVASFKTRSKTNAELLLGKWFLDSIEAPGASPVSECEKKSSYEFLESGIINVTLYYPNSSDICELNKEYLGLYEFVSESKLKMIETEDKSAEVDIEINETTLKLFVQGTIMTFLRAQD